MMTTRKKDFMDIFDNSGASCDTTENDNFVWQSGNLAWDFSVVEIDDDFTKLKAYAFKRLSLTETKEYKDEIDIRHLTGEEIFKKCREIHNYFCKVYRY